MCDSGIVTVRMISIYILILSYGATVGNNQNIVGTIPNITNEIMNNLGKSIKKENAHIKQYIYEKLRFILYNEHYTNGIKFSLTNYENIELNFKTPSKFIIDGWKGSVDSPMSISLKNEYVRLKLYNVVMVDWSMVAKDNFYPIPAIVGTDIVGEYVADFFLKLYEYTTNKNINVHLIGFSLGAHVAGFAGRKLMQHEFIADRVTGLDPAEPLIFNGLRATDGAFVDVIHTSSGIMGKAEPLGHADFYPNGGVFPQPYCGNNISCSHGRSWQYFAKTIKDPWHYLAYRCRSYNDYLNNTYCDDIVYMGEGLSKQARGVYYLRADDVYT